MKSIQHTFSEEVKSLFEVSHIRIQKLLEMAQGAIEVVILSLFVGSLINYFSFDLITNESLTTVLFKIIVEVIVIIVAIYYVRKMTKLIPFLFHYTKSYIPGRPSSDGENMIGKTIAFAVVFLGTLEKTKTKIKYFSKQFQLLL